MQPIGCMSTGALPVREKGERDDPPPAVVTHQLEGIDSLPCVDLSGIAEAREVAGICRRKVSAYGYLQGRHSLLEDFPASWAEGGLLHELRDGADEDPLWGVFGMGPHGGDRGVVQK